jgi:3-oxoacid CoA-transferase subunit B
MPWDRNQMAAWAAQELEDGMLGMGPFPFEGDEDPDLINGGKQTITELNRTAYFDSAQSFGMGGAMDLVAGVGRVIVVMDHTNKHGDSKLLQKCTLPLTGAGVVDRIITNLGVLDVVEGGLRIVECAEGVTKEELRAATLATVV